MKVTKQTAIRTRMQNWAFTVLFLAVVGLAAWASDRYAFTADWTAGNRNTLTEASRQVLTTLDEPVSITAFAREDSRTRGQIRDLIGKYRRESDLIRLEFVNPDLQPARVRELGVSRAGELVIRYGDRTEHVTELSESALSNALQRVARSGERWLVFLTGHGERNPTGQADHDLGALGREMENKGFTVQELNLAKERAIPDNTTALVIASPRKDYLPGEVELIRDYVGRGGNLLWLQEPGQGLHNLAPLAEQLGVRFPDGTVVDATGRMFQIDDPAIAVVADYPANPVTGDFGLLTVFPYAAAVEAETGDSPWETRPFLRTLNQSWIETGSLDGEIRFEPDAGDRGGPVTLGRLLTRQYRPSGDTGPDDASGVEQRIAVIGDGDFLANAYVASSGNLDLGMNLVNWLSRDDDYIDISTKKAPDRRLDFTDLHYGLIGGGLLIGLPLLLMGTGLFVWIRRRRK